jgi:hypothetical protein
VSAEPAPRPQTPRDSSKRTVVTQADIRKHRKQFLLRSGLYPFLCGSSGPDTLLWLQPSYNLIVRARLAG